MPSDLTKNYFELFDIETSFDINLNDLESRFRKLQKEFHPDRFVSVSEQERRIAMQVTAQINQAYQVLLKPLSRGSYLLELEGIKINEETDTKMDTSFLMEQMELREQLSEVGKSRDPEKFLQKLSDKIKSDQERKTTELGRCLSKLSDDVNKSRARELVREMQFLEKITYQIEELEDEFY